MKKILILSLAALLPLACQTNTENTMSTLNLTQEWDKTFPKSELVNHCKVTFHNRYGIELAADLYVPKDAAGKLPAIAVSGPFGAVKEQSSGLYAQHMAERGFVTVAFDPSFTGESGGEPRRMASPDINTEDFLAAVDFLSNCDLVDPERIGIIGICGFGGMAVNAAALDPRIKATVASTMYDMSKVNVEGYFASEDTAQSPGRAAHEGLCFRHLRARRRRHRPAPGRCALVRQGLSRLLQDSARLPQAQRQLQ